MACDAFSSKKAERLLYRKRICFFGDSNTRAIYKDLLWLLENGTLIPESRLKSKNESSHCNDVRLSQGILHSGRNYEEARLYKENCYISFDFITRLFTPYFTDVIDNLKFNPDAIVINSCVWDLTRWGSNGVAAFKENIVKTFKYLKQKLPATRIIWLTTAPPNFTAFGGFFTKEVEFMRKMLPWHIVFANKYSSDIANSLNIDVLDTHYNLRFLLDNHTKDGIHWNSVAVRYIVNMLLTHLSLAWNFSLPGVYKLDKSFLEQSRIIHSQNVAKAGKRKSNSRLGKKNKQNRNTKNSNRYRPYGGICQSSHPPTWPLLSTPSLPQPLLQTPPSHVPLFEASSQFNNNNNNGRDNFFGAPNNNFNFRMDNDNTRFFARDIQNTIGNTSANVRNAPEFFRFANNQQRNRSNNLVEQLRRFLKMKK